MAGPRRKGGGGGGSGAGKPSRGGGKRANAPAASTTTSSSSSSEADDASPNWLAYGAATLAVLAAAYLQSSSPEPPPSPPSPAAPLKGDVVGVAPSLPETTRRDQEEPARDDPKKEAKSASASSSSSASFGLDDVLGPPDGPDAPFAGLPVFVHRNGEPEPCGGGRGAGHGSVGAEAADSDADFGFGGALRRRAGAAGRDPIFLTVWDTDAIVTRALVDSVLREGECRPTWGPATEGNEKEEGAASSSFWEHCDMGPERTPILPDHDKLVAVDREDGAAAAASSLPCHFHTREGRRIKSLEELADAARRAKRQEGDAKALHLYAVPAGRLFMFAPSAVGEVFRLDHIASPRRGRGIELEALSVSPRVFDVRNFFTREEAADVVLAALEETDDRGRMRRSQTVGDGESSRRTSSSGWVPGTRTALALKWRGAAMLGQTTFEESMIDGLQVLRYGTSQAYTPHFDFHSSPAIVEQSHDYDSSGVGTNRYATVLLYLTEPEEGGATVFVDGEESAPLEEAIAKLRGRTDDVSGLFEEGSWEETMAAQCESRLAVQPTAPRAVLFYSMMPTGERDDTSKHGGCPVLKGEKWAANMWFHNGPREGHPNAPRRGKDPPL